MLTPNTCSRPIKHSISISSSPIVDAEARIRGIRREPTGKAQQMMKDGLWIGWNLDCAAHKGDYIWAVLLPINWPTRRCAEVGGDCVTEANRQPFLDVTPSSFITLCFFFFCLGDMGKEEERQSKHFQTMWKKRKTRREPAISCYCRRYCVRLFRLGPNFLVNRIQSASKVSLFADWGCKQEEEVRVVWVNGSLTPPLLYII